MTWFTLIKFVHVLLAIIAVGFNASYAIWIGRAAADADRGVRTLRTVKFLDDRFANPAYILLLLTGLLMLVVGGIPITTFWLVLALILYAVLLVVGLGVYTPPSATRSARLRQRDLNHRSIATWPTAGRWSASCWQWLR